MNGNTINNEVTNPGAGATVLAGRYRVVRQLGQGGMGSVWLAEDTQLDNRKVAIKMLPSILVSNKRAYQQLKSEALVSLKLTHPNIATLRAFEENGGNPFLVVDFIDGQTLDDYLAEKGKLSEEETVRLLAPVAAALDYAHSKGVVHRDVKPANVMIATDGTPYVLDFGIAREIQETLTRVTGKLSSGTLMYMSPEQLNGDAPTPAQDVYSFAVMVYECLKGEPPFVRGNVEFQIMNKDAAPLDPHIAISGSVMAGLAKTAEERPGSCRAVLAAGADADRSADAPANAANPSRTDFGGGVQLWKDGPYWAECNVGAAKPEESGYYFMWGDTVGFRRVGERWQAVDGSRRNFSFSQDNCLTGKGNLRLRVAGYINGTGNLAAARDAATAYLGSPWRMPTKAELLTLDENCTSEWIQRNGVYGRLVSGTGEFASKSIFFPAAGYGCGFDLYDAGSYGNYWSSSPNSSCSFDAWYLGFTWAFFSRDNDHCRFCGQSVRPVRGCAK